MEEYVAKSVLKKELNIANLHSGIVNALQNIVDEIPVADVQEVKHGYWIDTTAYCGEFTCSVCKETCVTNKYKYCPHCGAKMDLKEGDTE